MSNLPPDYIEPDRTVMVCDECGGRECSINQVVRRCPWCGEGSLWPRDETELPSQCTSEPK